MTDNKTQMLCKCNMDGEKYEKKTYTYNFRILMS